MLVNKVQGQFWTSGTDLNCPGKYHWCARGRDFSPKEVTWASGHPDSSKGECVTVEMKANSSVLKTANCNSNFSYVCEVRFKYFKQKGAEN
jgi:beta-xylosidase